MDEKTGAEVFRDLQKWTAEMDQRLSARGAQPTALPALNIRLSASAPALSAEKIRRKAQADACRNEIDTFLRARARFAQVSERMNSAPAATPEQPAAEPQDRLQDYYGALHHAVQQLCGAEKPRFLETDSDHCAKA